MRQKQAEELIRQEYRIAVKCFDTFASEHEGIAVIREEYKELEREVFKNPAVRDSVAMRKEAQHLGAMAMRFLIDCCRTGRNKGGIGYGRE